MKKYFVCSDIHSFYKQFRQSLSSAGYNKNNKNHILIIDGDVFDRGDESLKLYKFLKSIPKSRLILIRGNHEELYLKLLEKEYPEFHDFSNGTVKTFCQVANMETFDNGIDTEDYLEDAKKYSDFEDGEYNDPEAKNIWNKVREKVKNSEVTKWIQSNKWVNYYELDKFVFVHSFVPVKLKKERENMVIGYFRDTGEKAYAKDYTHLVEELSWFEPDKNWRDNSASWRDATWGCPFKKFNANLFSEDKTLVVGHWHTSDFYRYLDGVHKYMNKCAPIYFSEKLIGLDGGCEYNYYRSEYTHHQNILVIDGNKCYNEFGKELKF